MYRSVRVPELQELQVGAIMPALPGVTEGFTVLRIEPERALVLGWLPRPGGPPIMTWAFVRGAAGYQPPFGLPPWTVRTLVPWGHFIMQRKQLLGIARRAEAHGPTELRRTGNPDSASGIGRQTASDLAARLRSAHSEQIHG